MAETQDTEITLGTGKMLVLFFGLVALCSAFFAVGFKLGRGSGMDAPLSSTVVTNGTARPSTAKPATNPSDLTFYKTVGQDAAATPLTTPDTASKTPTASAAASTDSPVAADPVPSPTSGYFVQVAAVSKQEDAESLVDALKKKQYSAFTNMLADKLYHVQVGPFGDIKDAEVTRAKLVGDGYNPILKK
jgi:cell division septation protein DedD